MSPACITLSPEIARRIIEWLQKIQKMWSSEESFTCHNVWQQQQDHKVFHGLLHHQTREKKNTWYIAFVECTLTQYPKSWITKK